MSAAARRQRIAEALLKLSDLMDDTSIAGRDPASPLSFSCVTPEVLQSQNDVLHKQMLDEHLSFSPLGMDGRPCRRYPILLPYICLDKGTNSSYRSSEKQSDHWFEAENDNEYDKSTFICILYQGYFLTAMLLAANLNKEEKLKALENLVTQTEYLSRTGKDSTYLSAQEPVSSEVARTGRLRRSTISRHVVEKATIGGTGGGFAPTLIQNTLRVGGLRF